MFRDNQLAIPVDTALLILYKLDLQHLYIFMKLSRTCRTIAGREEIWQRNYAYYFPLNTSFSPISWFQLFKSHYRLPNKKFMYNFLKLYQTCFAVTADGQAKLGKLEARILACMSFDDWFNVVKFLRQENRMNSGGQEIQMIRLICLALAKYIVEYVDKTRGWCAKIEAVHTELAALSALERLDEDPHRQDQMARFTRRNELLQQLSILNNITRMDALGCEDVYVQHFQVHVGVTFQEFKKQSESNLLQLQPRKPEMTAA